MQENKIVSFFFPLIPPVSQKHHFYEPPFRAAPTETPLLTGAWYAPIL